MGIYDTLNQEQKKAVFTTQGPVLVLAGAGSGKTRALVHRVAYLIAECSVNPWNILAITFTNKAAEEMRERVDGIVGFGAESVWVATFHATCARILRRHAQLIGYDTNFVIYDTDDQKAVMKDICKRLQIDTKVLKERTILSAISAAKEELTTPAEYELGAAGDYMKQRIAAAYREYEAALYKNNAMDFDDLIAKAVELFRSSPETLAAYQNRFRYIMIDEYQDTNTAQFHLVRLLAEKSKNLCVVGDDDQSIYKFRGANIRNILEFEQQYPQAAVIRLEQNYRSSQNILDAANALICNNTARKGKSLWTNKGAGSPIHFWQLDTAYEEANDIVEDIARKKREGRAAYAECAVLFRTNAQARILEEQFILAGIPYLIVGGVNFYARKEIKDLLAYLKTIDNGRDDLAAMRIINVPRRGIGVATIARVQEYALENNISFFDALVRANEIASIGRAVAKIEPFVKMIQVLRSKQAYYSVEELLCDVIEMTGYIRDLEASDEEDAKNRIENIDELLSKAADYGEMAQEPTLSAFLEEVALVADIDNAAADADKVLLMTMHSAKGLEFAHVYLAGMEDGIFPSHMATASDDLTDLEEERRLAYVGITRAKEELTLTCAKQRMVRGETQYNPVSRFVEEIPKELFDRGFFVQKRRKFREYDEEFVSGDNPQSQDAPFQRSGFVRPKAMLSPKKTSLEVKPFIARGIESLNGVSGLSKGMPEAAGVPDYREGDRVRHMKYGEGTVLAIEQKPRDYQVTVAFDGAGQKIMYAAFAKLKKI